MNDIDTIQSLLTFNEIRILSSMAGSQALSALASDKVDPAVVIEWYERGLMMAKALVRPDLKNMQ